MEKNHIKLSTQATLEVCQHPHLSPSVLATVMVFFSWKHCGTCISCSKKGTSPVCEEHLTSTYSENVRIHKYVFRERTYSETLGWSPRIFLQLVYYHLALIPMTSKSTAICGILNRNCSCNAVFIDIGYVAHLLE